MINLKKQIVDQSAHAIASFVVMLVFILLPKFLSFIWLSFCLGMVRELTEEGNNVKLSHVSNILRSRGSLIDLSGWVFGGFLFTVACYIF